MKRLAVALAVVLSLASIRAARADEPIVLKFSHVVAPDAPKGKAALYFKELAEKYTGGRVKVEVFPNSSLYKDKEELEALQLGSVQLLAPSISKFSPLGVKEFDIFDLPFLLSDEARARQMMASPMMADLNKKLENKGVSPLAYWDNGAHDYTANKPLIMPDDFRGMKMRIQGGKVQDAVTRELGAIPQIIAFGELYQALQTGVVDGEDNVPTNILTQKILRSAEAPDHFPPWPVDLCARHQQDLLEFASAGCTRAARSRREGVDRLLQCHRGEGQRGRDREDQGVGQDRNSHPH